MAYGEIDPFTGKRKKSGGRQVGTPNRGTSARYAAMARVNEALAVMGDDTLTGIEVLKHPDTPLDVKIQCAGLLTKHETPATEENNYVCYQPPALPGDTPVAQMAVWRALYDQQGNDDPEYTAACKRVLELAVGRKMPKCLDGGKHIPPIGNP